MNTVHLISDVRAQVKTWQQEGACIGFVPTMGNLHAGHMRLVEAAKKQCDKVIVSVFVNPTQFGPNEDFDTYPRTLEADQALLQQHGADLLFAPSINEMYPQDTFTWVDVDYLGDRLCGAKRPGHFRGVTTVVSKLLHITTPDCAFFGEKDFQQLAIIKRMATDQLFATKIVGVPTEREASGLALSSRNGYLSADEKAQALNIYQQLQQAKAAIEAGERDYAALSVNATQALTAAGFKVDYFEIVDAADLSPATNTTTELRILTAAALGNTRLIDNISCIIVQN
ncbi:MAG TPA: pantoate--beta-alanine ligase [Alcanivoracaceae bacterium]|nr:pantoate--beta-alanine ligase [Alcanivoracaceae bacterium]